MTVGTNCFAVILVQIGQLAKDSLLETLRCITTDKSQDSRVKEAAAQAVTILDPCVAFSYHGIR